ncbi:MAG: GPW/gp25 family protein [Rhodospirillaceae bacterium]
MDRQTGLPLSGMDHIRQSVADIWTTPIGSCVLRRDYGSEGFDLIDAPANEATLLRLWAAKATAILKWEDRVIPRKMALVEAGLDGRTVHELTLELTETGETFLAEVPV